MCLADSHDFVSKASATDAGCSRSISPALLAVWLEYQAALIRYNRQPPRELETVCSDK